MVLHLAGLLSSIAHTVCPQIWLHWLCPSLGWWLKGAWAFAVNAPKVWKSLPEDLRFSKLSVYFQISFKNFFNGKSFFNSWGWSLEHSPRDSTRHSWFAAPFWLRHGFCFRPPNSNPTRSVSEEERFTCTFWLICSYFVDLVIFFLWFLYFCHV